MKKLGNLVAVVGEYESNGETKKQYHRCGACFVNDKKQISIKLDAVPTNFNGWLNVYPDEEKPAQKRTEAPVADFDDDLPF